jgi:hypothetical protein
MEIIHYFCASCDLRNNPRRVIVKDLIAYNLEEDGIFVNTIDELNKLMNINYLTYVLFNDCNVCSNSVLDYLKKNWRLGYQYKDDKFVQINNGNWKKCPKNTILYWEFEYGYIGKKITVIAQSGSHHFNKDEILEKYLNIHEDINEFIILFTGDFSEGYQYICEVLKNYFFVKYYFNFLGYSACFATRNIATKCALK